MDYTQISIIKRDGKTEPFSLDKIVRAITKAFRAGGITDEGQAVEQIASDVAAAITKAEISVEEIQDMVEERLMKRNPSIAKRYIIYREWRNVERDRRSSIKSVMDGIVTVEKNDINLSNANMSSHTPAGQMMTFASEITKDYALKYLVGVRHGRAHRDGDIHIHDLDYYPTKTTTCIQYDLGDIYERGFSTKNGSVRTPQSIQSYATLATIVFQTNQNEQHGGQSIPAFDHFMAPGVLKTFRRHLTDMTLFLCGVRGGVTLERAELKALVAEHVPTIEPCETAVGRLFAALRQSGVEVADEDIRRIWRQAYDTTRRETHQAMEGFIHNLNTMHSRGGNQVVFSSVNYGTDFSPEGRMVIRELLSATIEGLGHGEVPVFPIQIFKVKEGVSWSEEDYAAAVKDFDKALAGEIKFKTPNFDLLIEACRTTSVALFPNFMFLDAPFNRHEKWRIDDPDRFRYEVATMGCRTRVFENLHGEKSSWGRGNLSFTSMNLPRLAIEAMREAGDMIPDGNKHAIRKEAREIFLESVRKTATMMAEQLYERYCFQRTALARQFPFMMSNDVWKGGGRLQPNDEVGDVLKHGTLGIGFIGGDGGDLRRRPCDLEGGVADALRRRDGDEPRGRGVQGQIRAELFGAGDPGRGIERTLHAHGPQALWGDSGRHRPRLLRQLVPRRRARAGFHRRENPPRSAVPRHHARRAYHLRRTRRRGPEESRGDPQDRQGDAGRGDRLRLDQPSDRHLPQVRPPRGDLLEMSRLRFGRHPAHAPHHGLPDRQPRIVELGQAGRGARSGKAPVISILTGIFCTSLAGRNSYIRSYAPASPHFTKPENRSAIIVGGPLSARLKSKFTRRKNSFLPPSPVACGKSPPKV